MNVLLRGVVGSTAYGLAGPDSDIDRLGVFAHNTVRLVELHRPEESMVVSNPDLTLHEARKFASLALSCNPTVSELMWLPDDLYEIRTPLGEHLIEIRRMFLSRQRVRDAYLGYATQQFRRLEDRGDGSFSADTRKRTAKHARHLARLVHQGLRLYRSGHLEIRLDDPQRFRDFGDQVAAGDLDAARRMIADHEAAFNDSPSVLADAPNEMAVEQWLRTVRAAYWRP